MPQDPNTRENGSTAKVSGDIDLLQLCREVNIQFIKAEQMHKSFRKDFIFKAKFKHKLAQLKTNGMKLEIIEMIRNWLNDNAESLMKEIKHHGC